MPSGSHRAAPEASPLPSRPIVPLHLRPLAVVAALLVSCGRLESPEAHYGSHTAAQRAGAFSQGWLPSFLPPSATAIRERHDRASNRAIVRFQFGPRDLPKLTAPCRPATWTEVPEAPPDLVRAVSWWPAPFPPAATGPKPVLAFRCGVVSADGGSASSWLVVDGGSGTAYFWR